MGGGMAPTKDTKTVVVLGAAYGGPRAAQILAAGVPEGWKVVLIDRNSHMNHVYVMPRYAVLPGHEYKAFIAMTNVFLKPPSPFRVRLQAHITSVRPHSVTLSRSFPELGFPTNEIPFDYAIYALGGQLSTPLNLWETTADGKPIPTQRMESTVYHGEKPEGCAWFQEKQELIKAAPTVLVVGGGALGVQFATDIKEIYPEKHVTLLHSRQQLLPRFSSKMHDEIIDTCKKLGIEVILGDRLNLGSVDEGKTDENGRKIVRTNSGRVLKADLLLMCTGQAPNTAMLKAMDPATINESNQLARVLRTMQLYAPKPLASPDGTASIISTLQNLEISPTKDNDLESVDTTAYPHIFAVGDAADAFGAIAAGHTAYYQGEVAARNILRLIKRAATNAEASDEPLERYAAGPPAIKVSLGIKHAVVQVGDKVDPNDDGVPDLHADQVWPSLGNKVEKDDDMRV